MQGAKHVEKMERHREKREERNDVIDVFGRLAIDFLGRLKESYAPEGVPSSIAIQLIKYGTTFKRVVARVTYDREAVLDAVKNLKSLIYAYQVDRTPYFYIWRDSKHSVSKEEIESLFKGFEKLGFGSFRLSGLRSNEKYYEAVSKYADRVSASGLVIPLEDNLIISSEVPGDSGVGRYYNLVFLSKDASGGVKMTVSCTCPYAEKRRDLICKHGVATIYNYFPEIAAFIKTGGSGFEELASRFHDAFEAAKEEMNKLVQRYREDEELIVSNFAYLVIREVFNEISKAGGWIMRGEIHDVGETINYIRKIISSKRTEIHEVAESIGEVGYRSDPSKLIEVLESHGVYKSVEAVRRVLTMLQGSMVETPYTKALLIAAIQGSDLSSDPSIVSVVGDPGTGKTLSAESLSKLIGIRTLVIERRVSASEVYEKAREMIRDRVEKILDMISSKYPSARKHVADFVNRVGEIAFTDNSKSVVRAYASMIAKESGLSEADSDTIARALYSLARYYRSAVERYAGRKAVSRIAVDVRRRMLKKLEEMGIISSSDTKEEFNSGSVRYSVQETEDGYSIKVTIDLHYLLSKYKDVEKLSSILEELSKMGQTYVISSRAGAAVIKLSEEAYLEKMMKTRELDPLSKGRLIWVGGDAMNRGVIIADELFRAPDLAERLLTDFSKAAEDSRRTGIYIFTNNAEAVMGVDENTRYDALNSRVNLFVVTQSSVVHDNIRKALSEISSSEVGGGLPMLYMDQLILMKIASEEVSIPERIEKIVHSLPTLLTYDFYILRPEAVEASTQINEPLVVIVPKGSAATISSKTGYFESSFREAPRARMMPDRRLGHHVIRAAKTLAILNKSPSVDTDIFVEAVRLVIGSRVIPVDVKQPYQYIDAKYRYMEMVVEGIREVLSRDETATEKLIEILGSGSIPGRDLIKESLSEMASNPVLAAMFVRFLAAMLVSSKAAEFIKLSESIPGLRETLSMIRRYEKLYFVSLEEE